MQSSDMLTDHERRIAHLEGKLESLATKELLLQTNAELLKEMRLLINGLNDKVDSQTGEMRALISDQNDRINDQDRKYTKLAGAAAAVGLVLSLIVGAVNVFVGAVSAGIIRLAG